MEAFHEPSLRPRPRSRTRPRPANLVSRTRTRTRTRTIGFMVPMRDSGIVEAFHEPPLRPPPRPRHRFLLLASRTRTRTSTRTIGFMVPMRDSGIVEAFHEPPLSRPSATLSPPCGERAGRGVPIWFMAPIHVQILEVFAPHEPDFGRDIALRCPRPRISGRHRCAAELGADGAARRPHQVQCAKFCFGEISPGGRGTG